MGFRPKRGTVRTTIHAHPVIATATAFYAVGWSAYGLALDSPLAVPYFLEMLVLAWVIVRLDIRQPFSASTLAGLSLWGFMHMMGGMLQIGDTTLYETWVTPFLRWDQIVHAVGFGFGGIAMYETFLPWMLTPPSRMAAAWVAFLGSAAVGAINETIEFIASRFLTYANVGDEVNTGLDLIANAVGGGVAAWVVSRRVGRT